MNVGVGIPTAVPGTDPDALLQWIEGAERGPFSSIGVVDRLRYSSYEPMTVLAKAAAMTERVRLVTMVVIGRLRQTAVLAKEAATIDAISGGRLTLGLAVGARPDDYQASGVTLQDRGERLTGQLAELRLTWEKDEVGRLTSSGWGPPLLVGGLSDKSFLRAARYADGYVHGGGPPGTFERAADKARFMWAELARAGRPALWAQGYFALGDPEVVERGREYMRDYYSFTGPFAEKIAEGMLGTPQAIAQFVRGYAEAGCDELVLLPAVSDVDQIDRLAAAIAGS